MFKSLDKISKFLYLGTVIPLFLSLIAPLLVYSKFLFPFITTKTFFFRILVEIAVFFYILLILRRAEFRPKMTKLVLGVLIFFGIITLGVIFGINSYRSFWGNIERGEGLLTLYHILAFFFIASQILAPYPESTAQGARKRQSTLGVGWYWFLNTSIAVAVLTAIYALFQLLDLGFVIHSGESRLSSTIGNASFYAGYLLFSIFLSIYLLIKSRRRYSKIIYIAVILFLSFILIGTETRGSFLGLTSGLLLMALIYLIFAQGKIKAKKLAGIFLILIFLSTALIWWQKDSQLVRSVGILQRLTTISLDDVTTQSRLLTWDSSWQALKDRPLLGFGWENYNVAFNRYFHAEIFRDAGSQIWFDRAHNIIFDISVSSGFLGLISYLAIFVLAIRALYLYFKKTKDMQTFAILTSLLAAYFVQNIFVFDVLATYISFYLFLGFVVFLEKQTINVTLEGVPMESGRPIGYQDSIAPTKSSGLQNDTLSKFTPAISSILFILLIIAIYSFNILPAKANTRVVQALIAKARNQTAMAGELFKQAIDYNTNQSSEIRQKYAEFTIELARRKDLDQTFVANQFTSAINEIKNNIRENPLDVQNYLFLMILYNQSDQFDPSRIDLLFKTAEQALKLSPTRPQIYFEIGQAFMSRKEFNKGVTAFQAAVNLQPKALESHWNLAAALAIAGRSEEAQKEFDFLQKHGYDYYSKDNLLKMIIVYSNSKNWEKLADVYEGLIKLEPENGDWYAKLAATYQKLGDFDKARETVQKAVEINPNLAKEAEVFLQLLEQSSDFLPIENQEQILRAE